MIDQTKDKKDDALQQKLDKAKQAPRKEDARKTMEMKQAAEATQMQDDKVHAAKAAVQSNNAHAVTPIGSARVTENEVEVHAEPGKTGQKIASLKQASKAEILGRKDDEFKVLVDGKIGYVAADKTDYEKKPEVKKAVPKPVGSVTITAHAVHVRRGPAMDQASMGVLNQADKVKVYGEKNGFLEIRVGDEVGYIAAKLTDFAGQNTVNAKKEDKKNEQSIDKAPDALRNLLAKENLTGAEIAAARDMISKCPEAIRGDLFQALQTKPAYIRSQKGQQKKPGVRQDGSGLENLAACMTLLGISNPSADMPFETYLEQVKRDQKLPAEGGLETWGSVANAMGVSYEALCLPGDRTAIEKSFWSEIVREQLHQGKAIMACVNHQTVRVEAVEEKGLVLTMPESINTSELGTGYAEYQGRAEQLGQGRRGILAYESLNQLELQWVLSMS